MYSMKLALFTSINIRFITCGITKHIENYCELRQVIRTVAVKIPKIEWLVTLVGWL